MVTISQGLNLDKLDETTPEEVEEHLRTRWTNRGPLYDLYAKSLMADWAPVFLKLHRVSGETQRFLPSERELAKDPQEYARLHRQNEIVWTVPQLFSYIMYGWETGIRNEFRVLKGLGFTRAMTMEIVMFARLYAGMRGLGHAYHGVGDFLPDYGDGSGKPVFPPGWEPDPAAFQSGLDMTTRELTDADRRNLTAWYEKTVGYLPKSVNFGMKYDPHFTKVHRRMWEIAIKTLPKQVAPVLMMRDAMVHSQTDALREAALLGKSWGMSSDWIVRSVMYTASLFTSFRGLYVASDALEDIL